MLPYNKKLKPVARKLRCAMTNSERRLWQRVRRNQLKGYKFTRQKTIGNYIVDFYCPSAKLVIEIDGSQHYLEEGAEKDKIRDKRLADLGLTVMRFSNRDVFTNIEGVLQRIHRHLENPHGSHSHQAMPSESRDEQSDSYKMRTEKAE